MSDFPIRIILKLLDVMTFWFIIIAMGIIILYLTRQTNIQMESNRLTRQVNIMSNEASKTGGNGTLRYGEPFTVGKTKTMKVMRNNVTLEERRSGVNRGKFTTEGYVYK